MKIIKWALMGLTGMVIVTLLAIKLIYGLGRPYPDVSTPPLRSDAEPAITLPLPPGMVAAGPQGRIFFTYHPFHRPQDHAEHLVFEWTSSGAVPLAPDLAAQLHGVFGITVDRQNRLWAVRPGAMEGRPTQVLAIDIDSGKLAFEHTLPDGVGGFAQDLRVSADGRYVYLADTGLLRFTDAALLVLDTQTNEVREVLVGHETTAPQNWVMRRTDGSAYRLGYGLISFQVGVDGLELSKDGKWLIYAAMSHDSVYRVPTALLTNFDSQPEDIENAIETLGPAPMSDGIALTSAGAVILTDVENGGLAVLEDGKLQTLVALEGVDWADSVTLAPNGDIWFTDSRLTDLLDPFGNPASAEVMQQSAPYAIYRIPANRLAE
ncbi:SMP-30/gluconolactonase/LRE family protein [Sulfitobacter mediterraneus]|jgi:sugar lactone lactonase YvrE|uniref:Major royal jelly protein n=1 Tax=Sulfitobacter mediterraneus TaxID=83219 RepID=A0A2T6CGE7_9RHOB|nr:L-dopachrome tautomerase-related protein [Sulfitobacter mediterraneus]KIN77541.1 Major royal jelly protein [Sulfitobacter mediterraneus KCTC 32188]PTX74587.1 major royal jelly protein [Sulfitobacter mediterraneus]